jgi:drug/metabolite transporter (DMT)-like permease
MTAPKPVVPMQSPATARMQEAARHRALALVALGVAFYATGPVMIRASSVTGTVFSLWRLVIGVPLLAIPMTVLVRRGGRRPRGRTWIWAFWGGLVFGIHQVMFMVAIKATSVTDVTLMGTLAPVATAVLAARLFAERPGAPFRAWTAVAMAGAAIVILGGSTGPQGDLWGMVMAFGNIVFLSTFFVISKLSREEIDVVPFLTGTTAVAAFGVWAFALITGEPVASLSAGDVVLIVAVAILGSLGHFVTIWPLRWVPANIPSLFQLAVPLIAGALAWIFLDEGITPWHVVGGALTIAGVCGAVLSPSGRSFVAEGERNAREAGRESSVAS